MKLSEVAAALGAEVVGDGAHEVMRLVHPADASGPADLALALIPEAAASLPDSRAGAAVVRAETAVAPRLPRLVYAGHERLALAILTRLFDPGPACAPGVDASAVVAADATIAPYVRIGALVSVGSRSAIGEGTVILPGATIGADVTIGSGCTIHAGVRIGDRVVVGDRVIVQPNAVIGADGYGVVPIRNPDGSRNPLDLPLRIHSLGSVVIGDDVEIGAGTTIDRGTLRDTRIGRGTKIDNQVQIAHNVVIGEACIICGKSGLAGSAVLGDRVILGAGVGVTDHVIVGDDVTVMAGAAVVNNSRPGAVLQGVPAVDRQLNVDRYMSVARLRQLYPRVAELAKRLEALEKAEKGR